VLYDLKLVDTIVLIRKKQYVHFSSISIFHRTLGPETVLRPIQALPMPRRTAVAGDIENQKRSIRYSLLNRALIEVGQQLIALCIRFYLGSENQANEFDASGRATFGPRLPKGTN